MASGYQPTNHVWAIDRVNSLAGPVHRHLIELDKERYEVDTKHPVVDAAGVLLPGKFLTPKGQGKQSATQSPKE